ncbi:MAG: RnfABCDGE type electron transport complex subunit D, partial [Fusobacteriaceae bacterium]
MLGTLIALIRMKGGYPEGTAYAILIMNGFVPLINRYSIPKKFGAVKA